jgi:phosphoribosylaminoimidazole (AIR) synthetase
VSDTEMFRTFNMGVGYVLVVPPARVDEIAHWWSGNAAVLGKMPAPIRLGEIVAGERGVELV